MEISLLIVWPAQPGLLSAAHSPWKRTAIFCLVREGTGVSLQAWGPQGQLLFCTRMKPPWVCDPAKLWVLGMALEHCFNATAPSSWIFSERRNIWFGKNKKKREQGGQQKVRDTSGHPSFGGARCSSPLRGEHNPRLCARSEYISPLSLSQMEPIEACEVPCGAGAGTQLATAMLHVPLRSKRMHATSNAPKSVIDSSKFMGRRDGAWVGERKHEKTFSCSLWSFLCTSLKKKHAHTHKICRSSPPNPALFDLCCRGFALLPKAALLVGLGWEQLHCCRGGGTEPRGSQHHSHPAVTLPSPRAAGWGDSPAAPWPPFSGAPAALINTNGWVIPPPSGAGGRGFMELCSCV